MVPSVYNAFTTCPVFSPLDFPVSQLQSNLALDPLPTSCHLPTAPRTLISFHLGGLSFSARRLEGVVLGQHMFPFSPVSFPPHDFHFFLHLSPPSTTNCQLFYVRIIYRRINDYHPMYLRGGTRYIFALSLSAYTSIFCTDYDRYRLAGMGQMYGSIGSLYCLSKFVPR